MVKSAKGHDVDMQALVMQNANAVALGNARMNARGDIIGKNGQVVKTREEIASEYHNTNSKAVKNVAISEDSSNMFTPPEPVKAPVQDEKIIEEVVVTKKKTKE